jgi:thioredoxin-dependent peroxiredoxin
MRMLFSGGAAVPLLLSACAMLLSMSLPSRADDMPSAGAAAPGFQLNSQEGQPVSLQDYRGKWVVLYFYPKDMTTGCTIEAHNFQRDLAKYDDRKAVILGVSVDSVDSHQQFCAKESLTFKLLSDPGHTVVSAYGSLSPNGMAARNTFLIDPEGRIRKVFTKVNPTAHSDEVLAAIGEAQTGSN